jgi:hypothetical protein
MITKCHKDADGMSHQKVETLCAMMEQDFTFPYRDYLSDDSDEAKVTNWHQ